MTTAALADTNYQLTPDKTHNDPAVILQVMTAGEKTTRQRVAEVLRSERMTPSDLADEFHIPPSTAISHVRHIAQSVDQTDEQVEVIPPTCDACGFAEFDNLANLPSRCPACNHERINEPVFRLASISQ